MMINYVIMITTLMIVSGPVMPSKVIYLVLMCIGINIYQLSLLTILNTPFVFIHDINIMYGIYVNSLQGIALIRT